MTILHDVKAKQHVIKNVWTGAAQIDLEDRWTFWFSLIRHCLRIVFPLSVFFFFVFFFSSIVCFSSRTVKSERNGNSYGDINIICIVKFLKQNWVYRSLWTMKKQTTISFALVFLCVAGKCRSSAQIHGWNHPSLFHTEISIVWDILINMSKWLLFYMQFYIILDWQ